MQIAAIICSLLCSVLIHAKQFVVVIDPAGDARNTGRQHDDGWERGITFQCAQELQKRMELHGSAIRLIMTRMPGESLSPLQQAQLANQLHADLFISLHFYQEQQLIPHWYTYMLDLGHEYVIKPRDYTCYYYDQAHILCATQTQKYAQRIANYALTCDQKAIAFHKPACAPIKSLIGVTCPAFAFDVGLKGKDGWKIVVEHLTGLLHELHALWEQS